MPDCGHAKLYAMDFANQPKAIYECLWCKLDKLQAENLGLAVRREEYDRTVELLVEAQEERDSLKVSLATATEERIAGRRNMQAEIDRLASKLDRMRSALHELHATVRGECPSLLNEDSSGNGQLAVEIEDLLQEPPR